MRSEQWIRTQKRRVRKKYRKGGIGNMYFSPKEFRDYRHGKHWIGLRKAVENILSHTRMQAYENESM